MDDPKPATSDIMVVDPVNLANMHGSTRQLITPATPLMKRKKLSLMIKLAFFLWKAASMVANLVMYMMSLYLLESTDSDGSGNGTLSNTDLATFTVRGHCGLVFCYLIYSHFDIYSQQQLAYYVFILGCFFSGLFYVFVIYSESDSDNDNAGNTTKAQPSVVQTIYSGRTLWNDVPENSNQCYIIGVCGGSASGKTTVAKKIIAQLSAPCVALLSMDNFYKVLSNEEKKMAHESKYNFDHPNAFDFELFVETLAKLKEGKPVQVPIYNFETHSRESSSVSVAAHLYNTNYSFFVPKQTQILPKKVLIVEGILIFSKKQLTDMMDIKVFIDEDDDVRLMRRIMRDIKERGRDMQGVLKQYTQFVKPMFDKFIKPSMKNADVIVPPGGKTTVAIDLLVVKVQALLQDN